MGKETLKIQVRDVQTEQVLFECSLSEAEKAYAHAAELEEMGLDVKVVDPTLSETLTSALGLSVEQVRKYEESMIEEMEDHDGSCCFVDADEEKKIH